MRWAFVESHNNITTNTPLNVYRALRRKDVLGTINVGLESNAFLLDLTTMSQRIHLVTTAIGKDRSVPTVELVQATSIFQHLGTRAQVQMVGIPQNNLGFDIITQLMGVHAFYRTYRPDGHKNWRFDLTVVRRDRPRPGFGAWVGMFQFEL